MLLSEAITQMVQHMAEHGDRDLVIRFGTELQTFQIRFEALREGGHLTEIKLTLEQDIFRKI